MKKTASLAIATLLASIIGCASTSGPVPMRGAEVTAPDRAPEVKAYAGKVPGVGQPQLISRTFVGQPPMVPHTVEQYVPLTMEENACMECHHDGGNARPEDAADRRRAISRRRSSQVTASRRVEMSRFQCDTCHVPQVDAKELVDSKFVGVTK